MDALDVPEQTMSQAVRKDPLVSVLPISVEEYLAAERVAECKHEYIDGYVYALAGASREHNRLAVNLQGVLWRHLQDSPCEVLNSDMRLRVSPTKYLYPDLMVCCDPTDDAPYHVDRPCVVVEVLSHDTRRHDQTEKARLYWSVPSIEQYVMIEQDDLGVHVLSRGDDRWNWATLTQPDQELIIPSLDFRVPLSTLYARTDLLASDES